MTRALSLHHLSMLGATPDELASAAAVGGFEHIGVRILSPDDGTYLHGLAGNVDAQRRFAQKCSDVGVALLDTEAVWIREETRVESLAPVLDASAALGAQYVLTVGFNPHREQLIHQLGTFADMADARGLYVPLEFITYTAVGSLADAWSIVQAIGRHNLGVLIDALQFYRAGAEFDVLSMIPPDRLPYAQVADGPLAGPTSVEGLRREARTARLLPGEGELDLARLISRLPADVPLSVEAPTLRLADQPFDIAASLLHESMAHLVDPSHSLEGVHQHER